MIFACTLFMSAAAQEVTNKEFKVIDDNAIVVDDIDDEVVVKTQEEKVQELKSKVEILYTEKFGDAWEQTRKCVMGGIKKENPTSYENAWLEKSWIKDNVHYLDEEKWSKYIVEAPKGSKPWLIFTCSWPMARPGTDSIC